VAPDNLVQGCLDREVGIVVLSFDPAIDVEAAVQREGIVQPDEIQLEGSTFRVRLSSFFCCLNALLWKRNEPPTDHAKLEMA
jgi:hypothetical protein